MGQHESRQPLSFFIYQCLSVCVSVTLCKTKMYLLSLKMKEETFTFKKKNSTSAQTMLYQKTTRAARSLTRLFVLH